MFRLKVHSICACLGLGGLVSFGFAGLASAQDQAGQPVEKIEITGSSIKRIEAETALPVQVLTRKEIEATGAQTVEQLLQTISAASSSQNLVAASASGATTGGVSGVSLRGLSSLRTLVLVNGKRVAPYGIGFTNDSVTVDVNSIPLAAVERIEILKDGASAVYGSDAIAGVVNFILRKDFRGAEIDAYYGTAKSNPYIARITGTYGYGDLGKDRFNVMAMINYQHEDPIFGRDRSFAKSGINVANGNDVTSGNTFPANFIGFDPTTGATVFGTHNPGNPSCSPSVQDPLLSTATGCRFDPSPFVGLFPKVDRLAFFGSGRFQLTPSIEGYAEASYANNKQQTVIQPVPLSDQFSIPSTNPLANMEPYNGFLNGVAIQGANVAPGSAIVVTPASPYYPTTYVQGIVGAGAPLPDLLVRYRSFGTGLRDLTDTSDAPRTVVGVKGTAMNWDFDANLLYSASKVTEHVNGGFPALSKVLPLLNSGQVNFWGPNTPQVAAELAATGFVGDAFIDSTSMTAIQAKASREVVQLPGGSLAVAAGVEERHEAYKTDPNPTIQTGDISGYGGNFLQLSKGRNVSAVFAEVDAPIFKSLEADVAVRHDYYQGSGGSTTPKVALRFQPVKQVLLRGSIGQGFRAPSLADLFSPDTQSVTPVISDPVRCPITNSPRDCVTQYTSIAGGNAQLKSEKSYNRTFGFVLEPVTDISVAVDFFHMTLINEIGNGIPAEVILANQAQYANLITRGPVDPAFPNLPGPITQLDQRNINSGLLKISGFDLDGTFGFHLGDYGKLTIRATGTYFSRWDSQNNDGTFTSNIDQVDPNTGGILNRWRHFLSANWQYGPWSTTVTQLHQNSYQDLPSTITGNIPEVGEYNVYGLHETYSGIKNLELTLGINNVLDTNPPYTNAGGQTSFQAGYDPSYVDPRGRFFYADVKWTIK